MIQTVVVSKGETINSVAQKYGTSAQSVRSLNELDPGTSLVEGQTLVVNTPDNRYYVQPGDSLYKISQTYNISLQQLASANGLSPNSQLNIGQRLYVPVGQKRSIESVGYLQPTSDPISQALLNAARDNSRDLTYIAPFSFEMKRDGTLKEPPIEPVIPIAEQNRVVPMLVVTNIENGSFSRSLATSVLSSAAVQDKLITNIIQTARKYNMGDVNFDLENLAPSDRYPYNAFLRKVKARLPEGFMLSTTLAPKTTSTQTGTHAAQDYKAHGEIVDFVVIMTYDWGWQGGPPRAVSPIGPVRDVIKYAKTQMPARKILLGQNLYGFDWTLPFKPGNPPAKALSAKGAVDLARQNNVAIKYDSKEQAPTFKYYDAQGRQHEVWFEDARSVQQKFNLIKSEGLRGISYWKLGLPFPQNWVLLRNNFNIAKLR
ncbi:LysM peptidoglycan-binding domain-containing protein [Priestia taiwanensis]|uniref:Glycosyl hydrolase n=1 Tax=Priestia taiwanensis TaxID=1347902 RepID=A0A917AIQ4_9BACI|nr:LysM peptidoglycan-binding domain-containing protein [Priestia taiwanensis]MBM7361560.1 spore germination protein [Priestia taiwanensis]GGE55178.1 glycosyl hydrolase [Priestia taiwanensis]